MKRLKRINELKSSFKTRLKNYDAKLTITRKLYLGFATTIMFFIIALTFAFVKTTQINQINHTIQQQANFTATLQEIHSHVHEQLASIKEWTLTGDKAALEQAKVAQKASQALEQKLLENVADPLIKEKLQQIIKADKLISCIWEVRLSPMVRDGNYQLAYSSMVNEDQPIFQRLLKQTDELVESNSSYNEQLQQETIVAGRQAMIVVAFFSLVATFLGVSCSILATKSINRPLQEVIIGARRIASGDLTGQINVSNQDEMGLLASVFNDMVAQLNNIISQLVKYSGYLQEDSIKLVADSQQVSANINVINNILTDLNEGAKRDEHYASEALQAAVKVNDAAEKGSIAVNLAVDKIEEIKRQSEYTVEMVQSLNQQTNQIKQILDVVHEIAEQTNLLSLNASIEAVRAGDHGRGFAVVAKEVRKLADNSRQSVSEISGIIHNVEETALRLLDVVEEGSVTATAGVKTIANTGETFKDILTSVQTNTQLVEEIYVANQEVSKSIQHVAASTQQVTANMAAITEVSQLLGGLSDKLNHTVNNFTVS